MCINIKCMIENVRALHPFPKKTFLIRPKLRSTSKHRNHFGRIALRMCPVIDVYVYVEAGKRRRDLRFKVLIWEDVLRVLTTLELLGHRFSLARARLRQQPFVRARSWFAVIYTKPQIYNFSKQKLSFLPRDSIFFFLLLEKVHKNLSYDEFWENRDGFLI